VASFLAGRLPFLSIATVIEECLGRVPNTRIEDLAGLLDSDLTARREAQRIIAGLAT
jgi:1-deoxy-D-xylulose-5-phosphate reductoisomerase